MENSPFNKLSPELRNAIYELVVADHVEEVANTENCTKIVVALAQTCTKIRSECLLMSFDNRTFTHLITYVVEFVPPSGRRIRAFPEKSFTRVFRWLEAIPPKCHAAISRLTLKLNIGACLLLRDDPSFPRLHEEWKQLMEMLKSCEYTGDRLVFKLVQYYTKDEKTAFKRLVEEDFEGTKVKNGNLTLLNGRPPPVLKRRVPRPGAPSQ